MPSCFPDFPDSRRWPRQDFSLLERASCVVPAERDMHRRSFPLTGLRFCPSAMSATSYWTRLQTRAFWSPLLSVHPFGYFSQWGMGKPYPLGTGGGSRLLLASGELDLHTLTTSLSLSARLSHTIYKHTSLKFFSLNSEVLFSPREKV